MSLKKSKPTYTVSCHIECLQSKVWKAILPEHCNNSRNCILSHLEILRKGFSLPAGHTLLITRSPINVHDQVYRCFQYAMTIHLGGIWIHDLSMPSLPKAPRGKSRNDVSFYGENSPLLHALWRITFPIPEKRHMRLLRVFNIDGIGARLQQVRTPGQRLHFLYLLYGTSQTLNCV